MKSKKWFGFVCGFLAAVMLFGVTNMPTLAASMNEFIEVFTGVRVYVNDAPLDPGDLHGNPDAFIYNGTTYVAVRGVSNSLGQDVLWDGDTRSVYIGKHAGNAAYLLNVCPPYEKSFHYKEDASFNMSGTKYTNGFTMYQNGYAHFNLNGKYEYLDFDIGHIDGTSMESYDECNIYLDGKLAKSIDLSPDMMPTHYKVELKGAVQMKIEIVKKLSSIWTASYGFANIMVS